MRVENKRQRGGETEGRGGGRKQLAIAKLGFFSCFFLLFFFFFLLFSHLLSCGSDKRAVRLRGKGKQRAGERAFPARA